MTVAAMTVDPARVGAVLARAFADDPMFRYVLPDPRARTQRLPTLFAGSARHAARYGGVASVEDGRGIAVWTDQAHMTIGFADAIRGGMMTLPLRLGIGAVGRLQRHEGAAETLITRVAPQPFAYLQSLGVEPASHGEGLGRRTVATALAQMRAAGHGRCVLRTENRTNVAMYEHLGFRLCGEERIAASDLTAWVFVRDTGDGSDDRHGTL